MKKCKKEKGITLVALIITIVVLLILAVVAIGAVQDSNIIGHAQNAADSYELGKGKEEGDIKDAEDLLNKYANGGNNGTIDSAVLLAKFKENPEAFKHPDQRADNGDRAIGTDGKAVNMDYWNYTIINDETKEIALYKVVGSEKHAAYTENIIDGKIIGAVPQYIKCEGVEGIYTVTSMEQTFSYREDLEIAPTIPNTVTVVDSMFLGCSKLNQAPTIPNGVVDADYMFLWCSKLTQASTIPNSVTNARGMFSDCTSLTQAPIIPDSVTDANGMFSGCISLTQAPIIPDSVTDATRMFCGCTSLTQAQIIPNSVIYAEHIFSECTNLVGTLRIESSNIMRYMGNVIANTGINKIQVPANSTTESTIREEYGNNPNITIETFEVEE